MTQTKTPPAKRTQQKKAEALVPAVVPKETIKTAHVAFRDVEVPESVEVISKKGWVKWGADNLFPQFLWYLFYCSPIHQGVISSKVDYIVSGGLSFAGEEEEFNQVFTNGLSQYDLDEVAEMLCLDLEVSNSYYILCKLDLLTKKWYIEQMDFELIRPDEHGVKFYYSENWSTDAQSAEKTGYREIFSIFHRPEGSTECLLQVKTKSRQRKTADPRNRVKVTGGFFSVPSYSGGIESILTDIEINFFRYAEVVNGYKGGSIIYLGNGEPENETARDKILRDLKVEITDRRKQGGIGIIFGEGKDGAPHIEQMSGNDLDKRYESTESGLLSKMMIAHSVTNPKLFAVMATGTLSETDDQASFERFQKTYGNKRRKNIVSSLNFVLKKLNGMKGKLEFNVPTLAVENQLDEQGQFLARVNSMSPLVANAGLSVLTVNEKRFYIWGFPAIAGGDAAPIAPTAVAMRALKGTDPAIIGFEQVGRPKEMVKIFHSREHAEFDIDNDNDFRDEFFKNKFATALTDIQRNILQLIADGKKSKEIQEATNLDAKQLAKQLSAMDKLGYTEGLKLTDKGQIEIIELQDVEVVYTYEERPDAPPLIGTSRDFCVQLLKMDKVYTRVEIDSISTALGRNVWLYRGGWYHDPETDKNQPSCRHYWLQHLVIKKAS